MPPTIKSIPVLYGYYKGYKLEFDNDYCIIPEDQVCTYFPIIITQAVKHTLNGNNIRYLARIANKPCRLFHASLKDNQWTIEEEAPEKIPLTIAENALVLLLNPDYIDTLKGSKKSGNSEHSLVDLPHIYIKPTVTQQELQATSLYALLASLDSNAIHCPIAKKIKKERTTVLR